MVCESAAFVGLKFFMQESGAGFPESPCPHIIARSASEEQGCHTVVSCRSRVAYLPNEVGQVIHPEEFGFQ